MRALLPGWTASGLAATVALILGLTQEIIGALLIALLLGLLLRNVGLYRSALRAGVQKATKPLLRLGIVLLGLQLALTEILALGVPVLVLILGTVATGFLFTYWFARWLGLNPAAAILYAAGFSVCGASAVAAAQSVVEAEEDEAASALAMVTLWGTAAMLALPLLSRALGLTAEQSGVWIGLTVHEVAQVVAAGGMLGATALAVATVVKLGRVLLLAPVLTFSSLHWARRRAGADRFGREAPSRVPLIPLFVLGFLAMVVLRSATDLPEEVLRVASWLATWLLAAAMFGLGAGIEISKLLRTGGRGAVVGGASTLVLGGGTLVGALLLV